MSTPIAMRIWLTNLPSGPVWCVTSTCPSIFEAISFTSAGVLQRCTPPLKPFLKTPLPRPPAWICAFTTRLSDFNSFAAASASSGVRATLPGEVATPNFRKSSLA